MKVKEMMIRAATAHHANRKSADARIVNAVVLVSVAAAAMIPSLAMAAPWDGAATGVMNVLQGGLARTIAIILVIACGIAAAVGKLSVQWAVGIVIGITLIFGAPAIVDLISSWAA